jgi:hypothetical protein
MKKQSNILFAKFSKDSLTDIIMEVKETLANPFSLPAKKSFTTADLWNIRRQGKQMVHRRFVF